jgi:hypothetical protein
MDHDADARVLLGLLLDEPLRRFSHCELEALTGWPSWRTGDAVSLLVRDGLAHNDTSGGAWASRASSRAVDLL